MKNKQYVVVICVLIILFAVTILICNSKKEDALKRIEHCKLRVGNVTPWFFENSYFVNFYSAEVFGLALKNGKLPNVKDDKLFFKFIFSSNDDTKEFSKTATLTIYEKRYSSSMFGQGNLYQKKGFDHGFMSFNYLGDGWYKEFEGKSKFHVKKIPDNKYQGKLEIEFFDSSGDKYDIMTNKEEYIKEYVYSCF